MQMQELHGLFIHHPLQLLLRSPLRRRQIPDPRRSNLVLHKAIRQPFPCLGRCVDLCLRGWFIWVLQGLEELLEARKEETDPALEFCEVLVGFLVGWFVGDGAGEVGFGEEGVPAVFAEADFDCDGLWRGR